MNIKRYQAIFIAVLISTVVYYEHSFHGKVDQINETVNETNLIVKQIKITLLNTPYNMDNDYHCLASNIYWESRNQSLSGKMAVGHVVMNRVDNGRFPDTICNVVKQTKYYPSGGIDLHDCQFSWYCDGRGDTPFENEKHIYEDAFYLAVNMMDNRTMDMTEGATHYHSDKVHPYWADSLQRMTQIDNHIFYKRK
jgi:spore germination cell wall hydrolase CwlJ-like protein